MIIKARNTLKEKKKSDELTNNLVRCEKMQETKP